MEFMTQEEGRTFSNLLRAYFDIRRVLNQRVAKARFIREVGTITPEEAREIFTKMDEANKQ